MPTEKEEWLPSPVINLVDGPAFYNTSRLFKPGGIFDDAEAESHLQVGYPYIMDGGCKNLLLFYLGRKALSETKINEAKRRDESFNQKHIHIFWSWLQNTRIIFYPNQLYILTTLPISYIPAVVGTVCNWHKFDHERWLNLLRSGAKERGQGQTTRDCIVLINELYRRAVYKPFSITPNTQSDKQSIACTVHVLRHLDHIIPMVIEHLMRAGFDITKEHRRIIIHPSEKYPLFNIIRFMPSARVDKEAQGLRLEHDQFIHFSYLNSDH